VSCDISVIILNFNGRQWLDGCLQSLLQDLPSNTEVILVDNASTDGSRDLVRSAYPQVTLLELPRNVGFATGNNEGARIARGRLLAFLNNDTRVGRGWLRALAAAFEAPAIGLATSRIVVMNEPDVVDSAGDGYLVAGGAFKHHHGGAAADSIVNAGREVFGACGAACMIRRDVFDELGGFDDDFFIYYEDVDLSYRVRLRGYRCVYVADAIVEHAGSALMGAQSDRSVFYGQRNLEWVYFKNTPAWLLVRSLPAHIVYDVAAAVYFLSRRRFGAFLRGKWSALGGMARLVAKRRRVQQHRKATIAQLVAVMERRWLGLKRREKQFVARRSVAPRDAPRRT
jgi:GT2 family glycosyltransferase